MKKLKMIFISIFLVASVFIVGGFYIVNNVAPTNEITTATIKETLQELGELASMEYNYTKIGKYEDKIKLLGYDVPLTEKSFIVSYDGSIKFGILVDEIGVDVDEKSEKVTLKLPSPKILSHELFEDEMKVLDERNNLFNSIKVEDFSSFAAEKKFEAETEAIRKGGLAQSEEKARELIEKFVLNVIPESYILEITEV